MKGNSSNKSPTKEKYYEKRINEGYQISDLQAITAPSTISPTSKRQIGDRRNIIVQKSFIIVQDTFPRMTNEEPSGHMFVDQEISYWIGS